MTLPLHDYPDFQKPLNTADLREEWSDANVAAGFGTALQAFDVRQFSSLTFRFVALCNTAPASFQRASFAVQFFDDPDALYPVWEEDFSVHAQNSNGAGFGVTSGWLYVGIPVMGPFMSAFCLNNGSVAMSLSGLVVGSSRSFPGTYLRESIDPLTAGADKVDAKLTSGVSAVAAGASSFRPLRLHQGRVSYQFSTGTQPGTFNVTAADGELIRQILVAVGAEAVGELVLPSQSCRVQIINTGAGNGNFRATVVAQRQNW